MARIPLAAAAASSLGACLLLAALTAQLPFASGYAFVATRRAIEPRVGREAFQFSTESPPAARCRLPSRRGRGRSSSALAMVDQAVLQGVGIAVAGLAAGIGMVAFTEAQGERAKERGGGLSDSMTTRIAGGLIEDVEVSTISDLGSLTVQLEKALKEAGGASDEELVMTEEDKQRISDEADDGW